MARFTAKFLFMIFMAQSAYSRDFSTINDADWAAAARTAIETEASNKNLIVVISDDLSEDAKKPLRSYPGAILKSELPLQDEFYLPPGPYILISKFYFKNGIFTIGLTTGPILKSGMTNCGNTIVYPIVRNAKGRWASSGITELVKC